MRDEHQTRLGAQIARLREQQGWSQRALAKWVGIDQSAVSRIEAGRRRLSADELQRFADALHVSADELLKGVPAAPCGAVARPTDASAAAPAMPVCRRPARRASQRACRRPPVPTISPSRTGSIERRARFAPRAAPVVPDGSSAPPHGSRGRAPGEPARFRRLRLRRPRRSDRARTRSRPSPRARDARRCRGLAPSPRRPARRGGRRRARLVRAAAAGRGRRSRRSAGAPATRRRASRSGCAHTASSLRPGAPRRATSSSTASPVSGAASCTSIPTTARSPTSCRCSKTATAPR